MTNVEPMLRLPFCHSRFVINSSFACRAEGGSFVLRH
jgi:hypothetical protein